MDQTCLSLAAIEAIFALVGVPVGIVFTALLRNQATQISTLKELVNRQQTTLEGLLEVNQKAMTSRRRS